MMLSQKYERNCGIKAVMGMGLGENGGCLLQMVDHDSIDFNLARLNVTQPCRLNGLFEVHYRY